MNDDQLKLGTPVRCTQMLRRVRSSAEGFSDNVRWKASDITPRCGLFIGARTLSDGKRHYEDEVGYIYEPGSYFRAALVVFSTKENPVYVPFGAFTLEA